jgi:hypothetical protein
MGRKPKSDEDKRLDAAYNNAVRELQATWEKHEDVLFQERFKRDAGIRSSQICALLRLLVEKGILQ